MKAITLSELKGKGPDAFIAKTIECSNDHDYYLDELLDGQYLISYAEFPKSIHKELSDARVAYELLVKNK